MDKEEEQKPIEEETTVNSSEDKVNDDNQPTFEEKKEEIELSPEEKIKARFICSLSISYLDKIIACVRGKIEGTISNEPKGNNGFGYDPIFIPNKKKLTFGEMSSKVKYKMDHRFNAFKKIKKFL